jgi:hypothetical protein
VATCLEPTVYPGNSAANWNFLIVDFHLTSSPERSSPLWEKKSRLSQQKNVAMNVTN